METMKAKVLERVGSPLRLKHTTRLTLEKGELLIAVHTCGVCLTDLHVIDGVLSSPTPAPTIPIITKTTCYPLEQTNTALNDLRNGNVKGSAVIIVKGSLLT